MEPRITLVTLGVRDLGRARRFYEALGWVAGPGSDDNIVFFQVGGTVLGLWDRAQLAADSGVVDAGGWGGVTLAHNVRSPEEVDALLDRAELAGATVVRAAVATEWGGYAGGFVDPEGHPWEIAHNPFWPIADDGSVLL